MNEQSTYIFCFFFLSFLFSIAGLFLFLVFFSTSSFLPARCLPLFFLSFLSFFSFFLSFRVSLFICLLLVCSCFFFFFFFFTSFNSSIFLCPFRWCCVVMLKNCRLRWTGSFWILEELCWHKHQIKVMLYSYLHVHSASQRNNIKDRRMNKWRMIKTQEGLL